MTTTLDQQINALMGEHWVPTDQGSKFSRIFDTGKRHGNGTPVQQIKWTKDVLDLLSLTETA